MRLQNKTAIVTGGSSGIGQATAKAFAEEGANVVIFGRRQSELDAAQAQIGPSCLAVRGDVTVLADLDCLFESTASRFGGIDVLVANAGIAEFASLAETNESQFDAISNTNFKGVFFTVQRGLRFLNTGASVILVTSSANRMAMKSFSVYSATKAAVRSLARTLAAELLSEGIRVNALSPGPTKTSIMSVDRQSAPGTAEAGDPTDRFPMKRFARPSEIARAAVFLATDDSSYMTGSEMVIDGGMSEIR